MWKDLITLTLWGGGALVAVAVVLIVSFQEKIVYVPVVPGLSKEYPFTPARFGITYEDVWLRSKDGTRIHAWLLKFGDNTPGPTILFFQENAGNIAHRLESMAHMMDNLSCNIFMLSYRGYGASDGTPSQQGIQNDAQAALDHLISRSDIDEERIIVFGRSLGGAVGAHLTQQNPDKIAGLVLENTFTSIADMAAVMMPWLKFFVGSEGFRPLNVFVRSPWRTIDIIGKIPTPILFLAGKMDEMVPPSHMNKLYKGAKMSKSVTLFVVEDGSHMDTWIKGGDQYWGALEHFISRANIVSKLD